MKIFNKNRYDLWSQNRKVKTAYVFAIIFGIVMLVIGLAQIFAASSQVYFSLSPTIQYANANDERSVALTLNTYNQPVDNGQFVFTYDINVLSFVRYTAGASYVHPSTQVSQSGSYYLVFRVDPGAPGTLELGTITFKAKSIPSNQGGRFGYDATQTSASYGGAAYPGSYGQGAIVVYAAPPPTAQPSNPTPTPATPSTTPAIPQAPTPAPQAPTSPSTNTSPQQPSPSPSPIVTPTAPGLTAPSLSGGSYYPGYAPYNPGSAPVQPNKKRVAPIVFIVIGLTFIMAGVAYFVYNKYFRDQPRPMRAPAPEDLHTGLFDDKPKVSDEEETVITPIATAAAPEAGAESKTHSTPMPKHPPEIITKSKEKARVHHLAEFRKKLRRPTQAKKAQTTTAAPSHGAAVPTNASAKAPAQHVTPPEPVLAAPPKSTAVHPPASPPPLIPVLSPAPSSHASPAAKTPPEHQVPAWQAQLKVPHSASPDDLPDMFELAQEHPDSFGSSQLYESEHPSDKPKNEKDKK
ncbi:MAG TPA: hypothetical protein VM124_00275 [Candidatus Limnocylindrales bacterium]|nr:hypothetical protein [Candidatus Limnocylindrales bacterium]